jgi:hypothetical protein
VKCPAGCGGIVVRDQILDHLRRNCPSAICNVCKRNHPLDNPGLYCLGQRSDHRVSTDC